MTDEHQRETAPGEEAGPVSPQEVESAGRTCLVILFLAAVLLLVACGGLATRWLFTS